MYQTKYKVKYYIMEDTSHRFFAVGKLYAVQTPGLHAVNQNRGYSVTYTEGELDRIQSQ